jgi:RNase P subunit RPR2
MDFYLSFMCENCDEEIFYGVNRTYLEHQGLPVVSATIVEQISVDCDNCGHTTVTGELDVADSEDI